MIVLLANYKAWKIQQKIFVNSSAKGDHELGIGITSLPPSCIAKLFAKMWCLSHELVHRIFNHETQKMIRQTSFPGERKARSKRV